MSIINQRSDNDLIAIKGKARVANQNSGIPATPRMALGEVSNFVRQPTAIEATPKLRSNTFKANKHSSSESDEFDAIESVREMSREDFYFERMTSPAFPPAETITNLDMSDGSDADPDDDRYPPIEKLFMPSRDYDEYMIAAMEPEEKEMFNKMERTSDLVPMYISAEFSFISAEKVHEVELDYEPLPDDTLMTLDVGDDI